MDEIQRIFSNTRDYIYKKGYTDLLILGDFNFPVIKWSNGDVSSINASESSIEARFKDIVHDDFFIQYVSYPTFQLNINTLVLIFDLYIGINTLV